MDYTRGMCGGDIDRAIADMEWLEKSGRRETLGCSSCKFQLESLGVKYCDMDKKPFKGRKFCGSYDE